MIRDTPQGLSPRRRAVRRAQDLFCYHEKFAPRGVNDRFSKQQNNYTIPEICMIEDFHSIYGECMNIRDCIRKRLVKSVADKAAFEHKQSRNKGERPALIKFDKEHQIRKLDLYAEHR